MDRVVTEAELGSACRSLSESGYCLIENVLAPGRVGALRERIVSQARAERAIGGELRSRPRRLVTRSTSGFSSSSTRVTGFESSRFTLLLGHLRLMFLAGTTT